MIRNLAKVWAFLKRDFQSEVSYRLAFVMQIGGMLLSLVSFYYIAQMVDPKTEGLDGIPPFEWWLIGMSFQFYFSVALSSFATKIRSEQVLGTLEAMLVSPTPTSIVIFSSAAWDFTYGGLRMMILLGFAMGIFGIQLYTNSLFALALGVALTLLSSAGLGILSASFILYFKRGNPINWLLSGATTLLGNVFIPIQQLPEWIQPVSKILPATWSMKVVRGSLLQGQSFTDLRGDLMVLALLTLILLPAGLICSRFAIRRAKRAGTLVQY
jgi:ABC-2 type transport system permease protein